MRWLDRNSDRAITRDEAAILRSLFDRIDTNGDGRVVSKEVHEWYASDAAAPAESADDTDPYADITAGELFGWLRDITHISLESRAAATDSCHRRHAHGT